MTIFLDSILGRFGIQVCYDDGSGDGSGGDSSSPQRYQGPGSSNADATSTGNTDSNSNITSYTPGQDYSQGNTDYSNITSYTPGQDYSPPSNDYSNITSYTPGQDYSQNNNQNNNDNNNDNNDSSDNPVLLDLTGHGINIAELTRSTKFLDADGTGLSHGTAWAGVGSGVLFFDPNGSGQITQKNQYVFTEWDKTAKGDLEALLNVFDSNGDGKLDSGDAKFSLFKVMVSNAEGTVDWVSANDNHLSSKSDCAA